MWANSNTNSHVGWQSISDGNSYVYAHPDGSGYSDTYCAGYRYAYCIAKLHTELHIHIGHRNARAGNHRHWKPLR